VSIEPDDTIEKLNGLGKRDKNMTTPTMEEVRIKELFKQAMLELIQEQKELFSDLFTEVIEDIALVNAIKEGQETESVEREEVFKVLEGMA